MNKKATLACSWFFFIFGVLSSNLQAAGLDSVIIGKWPSIIPETGQIEFMKDGTLIIGKDVGDYKWLDQNRIRINLSPLQPSRVCTVQLEFGVLSLICQDKTYLHYLIERNNTRIINSEFSDKQPPKISDYYPTLPSAEWEFRSYFSEGRIGKDASKTKVFPPKEIVWLPKDHFASGKKLARFASLDHDNNNWNYDRGDFSFESDRVSIVTYILSEPDQIRVCAEELRTFPDSKNIDYESRGGDDGVYKYTYPSSFLLKSPIKSGTSWQREVMAGIKDTNVMDCAIEYTGETITTPMGGFDHCITVVLKNKKTNKNGKAWYAPGFGFVKSEWPGQTTFVVKSSIK